MVCQTAKLCVFVAAEEFVAEPITCEMLKLEKGFAKATKKHTKEYDGLMKKHKKERETCLGNQCKSMEKLSKSKK